MVSFVVPVYNMEALLPRFLESLLPQIGKNEILLVDDGSTDLSGELCDKYAILHPKNIRSFHKTNGGLSSARNFGIDVARGTFITFPDPDDWVEDNYVSVIEKQIASNCELFCFGHWIDYEDKRLAADNGDSLITFTAKEAQRALLVTPKINGFAWNKIFLLDIIRTNHLYFADDVGITEDLDFAYRYLKYCGFVLFCPKYRLYHYCQRSGAATHSGYSVRSIEVFKTFTNIIADSDDNKLVHAAKEEICNTAVNLIAAYYSSNVLDKANYNKILGFSRHYLKEMLLGSQFNSKRKIQALIACILPKVYVRMKMTRK